MSESKRQSESEATTPEGKDERQELSEEELAKVTGGRGVITVPGATKGIWVQQGEDTALEGSETIVKTPLKQ